MPDLVTITIDDVEYKVPAGMLLTDAAKEAVDIDIPVFCSHPKLDPLGACRMCLVEQDVRGRWAIVTACTTRVADGMKFRYASEAAKQAREDTLEFILVNHPLDCPICDKGGECPLQDQTLKHGPGASEFEEIKVHKAKHYPISDLIMLDQERCIICWRCIRYLEEWEDKPQLGLYHRGGQTVIDHFPDQPVDAKTSGNIIDLCPVGALTNRVSRFRYRPWEIKRTKSICVHCPVGCNVRLDTRINQLRRIVARGNQAVNDEWICDKGRFFHAFADAPDRLTTPMIRDAKGGELREATWDEALGLVAERLSGLADKHGPAAVGALGSAKLSNEAAYLLQKLMRSLVGTNNVDHRGGAAVLADPRGLSAIADLEKADVIVLAGVDPAEEQPVMDLLIRRAVRRKGAKLVILHPRKVEDTRYPGVYVPFQPGQETALFEGLSRQLIGDKTVKERVAKAPGYDDLAEWLKAGYAGISLDQQALAAAAQLLLGAQRAIILYGPSIVSGPNAEANRTALNNLALLAGLADRTYFLANETNSIGVRDMGLLPDRLPGHLPVSDPAARERLERQWGGKLPAEPGLSYDQMLEAASSGRLKALYLVGSDPAAQGPAGRAALEKAEFVVVQDMFLTDSARLADVVLPVVSWAEADNTYTNLERRVQRAPKALGNPHSQAVADWSIFVHLAKRWPGMGVSQGNEVERKDKKAKRRPEGSQGWKPWTYGIATAILDEISRTVPIYEKITWTALGEEGKQWPAEALPVAQRRLAVPQWKTPPPAPPLRGASSPLGGEGGESGSYPYVLVTGRVLYDGGTLFGKTDAARDLAAPTAVGVNPGDAAREKLADGHLVVVDSAAGQLTLAVKLDEAVLPGTLWIPYSLPGAPVETLLDASSASTGARVRIKAQ